MKKIKLFYKKASFFPLIIFILTIIYGLLRIDVGDTEGRTAYGWFYILFGIIPISILYLLAFILIMTHFVQLMKSFKKYNGIVKSLLIAFATSLLFIVVFVSFDYLNILLPVYSFQLPSTIGFAVNVLLLAIIGYQITKETKNTHFFEEQEQPKISLMRKILIGFAPLLITACTAGAVFGYQTSKSINLSHAYEEALSEKFQSVGTKSEVRIIKQYPSKDEKSGQISYALKEGRYELYGKAIVKMNEKTGKQEITSSSFTTVKKSLATVLRIQADSDAGKQVLKDYKLVVEKAIKKNNISPKKLFVENDQKTSYGQPHFSYLFDSKSEFIDEKAKKNRQSADKNKQAFAGYAAIPLKDIMSEYLVVVNIALEMGYELTEEETADIKNKFTEILSSLDVTNLPDGYYELGIYGDRGQLLTVKNHKIIHIDSTRSQQTLVPLSEGVDKAADDVKW